MSYSNTDELSGQQRTFKRLKVSHTSERPFIQADPPIMKNIPLPGELQNVIYENVVFSGYKVLEDRIYQAISNDTSARLLDNVQHRFFIDELDENAKSRLFERSILKIPSLQIPEEVMSLATPAILFVISDSETLMRFADIFVAYTENCKRIISLNVHLNITKAVRALPNFPLWQPCKEAHGQADKVDSIFKSWFSAIEHLPENCNIFLNFTCFWRDYRTLRGLLIRCGLSRRPVEFTFDEIDENGVPDLKWHAAQTVAVVGDLDILEQSGINESDRRILVDHGCRGFNGKRSSVVS